MVNIYLFIFCVVFVSCLIVIIALFALRLKMREKRRYEKIANKLAEKFRAEAFRETKGVNIGKKRDIMDSHC